MYLYWLHPRFKAYKVYDLKKILINKDVFYEQVFPYKISPETKITCPLPFVDKTADHRDNPSILANTPFEIFELQNINTKHSDENHLVTNTLRTNDSVDDQSSIDIDSSDPVATSPSSHPSNTSSFLILILKII